jgi:hypothetical protein
MAKKRKDGSETSTRSFNQRHHEESCGLMSNAMCEAGYVSIFQHSQFVFDGARVYTLWIHMGTGRQVMATVSPRGEIDYYDLVPNECFRPAHSYNEEELEIMRSLEGVSGLVGTTEGDL